MLLKSNALALGIKQNRKKKRQFLRFYLEPNTTVMLPISQVIEVLKIPLKKITPIAQMPAWTMGVYNWRGEILWMVDTGNLLGLNPWQEQNINHADATVVILTSDTTSKAKGSQRRSIGLVIKDVDDIEWCNLDEIKLDLPATVNSILKEFVSGYWFKPEQNIVFIIDGNTIFRSIS